MAVSGKIWECKIGAAEEPPPGADGPMRDAVEHAYRELTGRGPDFTFSGWGGELSEADLAVVEDRLPDPNVIVAEYRQQMEPAQRVANDVKEKFEHVRDYPMLFDRDDYATFRHWAIENRYGDSAYAFRKLLRLAGLLKYDERVET